MNKTMTELEILSVLQARQDLEIEHGYAQGDYVRLICPSCSGQSDECGNDPCDFNEENAYATFKHTDDCKRAEIVKYLEDRIATLNG